MIPHKAATNLDEVFAQTAEAQALLMDDPRRLLQTREIANTAGKLIDIIKCKLVAAQACNCEPEISQLGSFKGKPLPKTTRLIESPN